MTEAEKAWQLSGRVAGCAELREIRLFGVNGDLALPDTAESLTYKLDVNIEFQTLGEDVVNALVVSGNYSLVVSGSYDSDSEEEPPKVVGLDFTLAAMYFLLEQDTDPRIYEDAELEAFASTTGQFALYPYAREFIANMTGRMGLPSLHLGTLRLDREEPSED